VKNAISQQWERYRAKVMSPEAPFIQVHECQMAFYAGASAIVGEMIKLGDSAISVDKGAVKFQEYVDELKIFVSLL
jgi:hypothetical protein